jgi:hypothetical protein
MVHGPTQEVPIQHFPFVKVFAGSLNNVVASAEAYPKDTSHNNYKRVLFYIKRPVRVDNERAPRPEPDRCQGEGLRQEHTDRIRK